MPKAIMVMFDSLNRHMLPPYGCDWVHAPNFQRLAERTVTFANSYVGSMPCMPARRELHTGRYNFLHRSWGPLEPFDDSMPEILQAQRRLHAPGQRPLPLLGGGRLHLPHPLHQLGDRARPGGRPVEGRRRRSRHPGARRRPCAARCGGRTGSTARTCSARRISRRPRPSRWGWSSSAPTPPRTTGSCRSRPSTRTSRTSPSSTTRTSTPTTTTARTSTGRPTRRSQETPEQVEHCRYENAALVSMCDAYLGKVLDLMDELDLWKDTLLIVNTDHGFLLGEHDWWAKCVQPFYNEIAHTPLFLWDPRTGRRGETCDALVQTIDWGRRCWSTSAFRQRPTCRASRSRRRSRGEPLREACSSASTAGTSTSPTGATSTCARPPRRRTRRSTSTR